MGKFKVFNIRNNHGDQIIGYQVMSNSACGGQRTHFSRCGQHPESLARAKAECEAHAAKLNTEAAANLARHLAAKA